MPIIPLSHVLSVDDDEDSGEILALLMKSHQVAVTTAYSSAEALSRIKSNCFDLYLLDVWLPGLNGFELCRLIRESDLETPILFYSGAAYHADKQKAFAAGANAYVAKPDVEGLMETMLALLNGEKSDDVTARWVGAQPPSAEGRFASSFFSLNTASD